MHISLNTRFRSSRLARLILKIFTFLCIARILVACSALGTNAPTAVTAQVISSADRPLIQLELHGPKSSESDANNPFLHFRLSATFSNEGQVYEVPGYFAADGQSHETSADEGSIWKIHFAPPKAGLWQYQIDFTTAPNIAINDDHLAGVAVMPIHQTKGSIRVAEFERSSISGMHYAKNPYLLNYDKEAVWLTGANSPENLFAYQDFDGTYAYDPERQFIKSWGPHIRDWKEGDPAWQNGKGKGLIGAINYLANNNMNVVYALLFNVEGDARDVWPFVSHHKKDFTRFDVSKLAQWNIVIEHAKARGIVVNMMMQEQENQLLLDDGDTRIERRLFLREMIARFAHHENIIWNIGEENGGQYSYWPQGQSDQQRFSMIRYLKDNDPYKRALIAGTYPNQKERSDILNRLLRFDRFDGLSLQSEDKFHVHKDIVYWAKKSAEYNRPWLIFQDEIGPWHTGTKSDKEDPAHDAMRSHVLWPAITAGAAGVAWYFGWEKPPHDLNAEDFRSRENMWKQSSVARGIVAKLSLSSMKNANNLVQQGGATCLASSTELLLYDRKNLELHVELPSELASRKQIRVTVYRAIDGKVLSQSIIPTTKVLAIARSPDSAFATPYYPTSRIYDRVVVITL